jgi:hypothetical protein
MKLDAGDKAGLLAGFMLIWVCWPRRHGRYPKRRPDEHESYDEPKTPSQRIMFKLGRFIGLIVGALLRSTEK